MRYWKGSYDESFERDAGLRTDANEPFGRGDREMCYFRLLVGVQALAIIVATLLFVISR